MVRPSLWGDAEPWTEDGGYLSPVWAGRQLLAWHHWQSADQLAPGEWPNFDLVVLDGPGQERSLASEAWLIAISPDGTRVLVTQGWEPPDFNATIRVLRISDGAELAALPLPPRATLSGPGDWSGDQIVASITLDSRGEAASRAYLALFEVGDNRLTMVRGFELDTAPLEAIAQQPVVYGVGSARI
jgi:hypothetical protein